MLSGDVPRVNGQLAVSRAFGDKSLKSHLRSDPDIQDTNVDNSMDILVLASDGLWKVNHFCLMSPLIADPYEPLCAYVKNCLSNA